MASLSITHSSEFLKCKMDSFLSLWSQKIRVDFQFLSWSSKLVRWIISRLLDPNPETRISIEALMELGWFKKSLQLQGSVAEILCRRLKSEGWVVFSKCKRKVVVTANPTVMMEPFVKDLLGTEFEVNRKTGRAIGLVKKLGVLVGELKKLALLKEFSDDELPHLGLGYCESDHNFMFKCCY